MDYRIELFENVPNSEWDSFVKESSEGWLYQLSSYINFAISEGNKSYSFAIYNGSKQLLAVCPLYINEVVHKKFFFKYKITTATTSYAGPVLSSVLKDKGRKRVFKAVFDEIERIAIENNADTIIARLFDFSQFYLENRPNYNPLWSVGFYDYLSTPPRLMNYINLKKSSEQILSDMDEDCRSEVKKAIKNGLSFRIGCYEDLKLYYEIHKDSWNRTMGSHNSYDHFEKMYQFLSGDSTIKMFFAEYQGKPIAAVLLHLYKDSVIYYGGCSYEIARSLFANNFLLYNSIIWCKENNFEYFGIGIFDSYPGKNLKEYSVGKYKSQFTKHYYTAFEGKKVVSKKRLYKLFIKLYS